SASIEERFRVLQAGLDGTRSVDLVYYTASRDELTERRVDPYALIQFLGSWYVVGHDHLRQEVRIFKVERIRQATLTDSAFIRPAGSDAHRYLHNPQRAASRGARFLSRPPLARLINEEHPADRLRSLPDGSVELLLDFTRPEWVASWVLRFG